MSARTTKTKNQQTFIFKWRQAKGLSQKELADLLKIPVSTIISWENKKSVPHKDFEQKLKEVFALDESQLKQLNRQRHNIVHRLKKKNLNKKKVTSKPVVKKPVSRKKNATFNASLSTSESIIKLVKFFERTGQDGVLKNAEKFLKSELKKFKDEISQF